MSTDNHSLQSALSLMTLAASAIRDDGLAEYVELSDVGEAVRLAAERIKAWLGTGRDDTDEQPAFDALDACTAVGALIEAGINPRNGTTISPIRGTLRLAIGRLEEFLAGEPEDGPGATEEPVGGQLPQRDLAASNSRRITP